MDKGVKNMINKKKLFVWMVIILALIFSITYYFSNKYITNKNTQNNSVRASETDKSQELSDNLKICLVSGEKKEKVLTLAELKKELNLDSNLTEAELSKELKNKGYVLEVQENGEMTYKKDSSKSVKPNKYYIGEKDGYLAIYKTNENGTLLIENSNDVYTNSKKIESLNDIDKNKIENFELEYNTKDDAEENLSEFLS
jgi:flagellar biogenesis protein FliO